VPNPTSDPVEQSRNFRRGVRSGRIVEIGEGSSPIQHLPAINSSITQRTFWTAPIPGGKERKLFEIRGSVARPQWSPDGTLWPLSLTAAITASLSL